MTTYCYNHPDCIAHDPGPTHSEGPERIGAIVQALSSFDPPSFVWKEPTLADKGKLLLAHTAAYIDFVFRSIPDQGYTPIEVNEIVSEDDGGEVTVLGRCSGRALLRSVGAVLDAVDDVCLGHADNAFCLTRPAGHHALADKAMGFCVFANAIIGARYAQRAYDLKRIAIVDFDVHHGNGTQSFAEQDPSLFFASIHQLPLWPESGYAHETGNGNVLNVPVAPHTPRQNWLALWREKILRRLSQEPFDLLIVSAGFDAHRDDPKGSQELLTEDYTYLMASLLDLAQTKCDGRVIALLEGGYDIDASAQSAKAVTLALLASQRSTILFG